MERSFPSKVLQSLWVRFFLSLIAFIASYLQFAQAGWTLWFWVLFVLAIIAALLAVIPLIRDRLRERKERTAIYYEHWQKVKTLAELTNDFATFEKAKRLAGTIQGGGNVRVVAILPIEDRRVGVMLNIGEEENVEVGTRLLVYRIDHYTSDGQHIEQPLAVVQVTYVQTGNNCSHAAVLHRLDREFWDQVTTRLKREKKMDPPKNIAVPYVPKELHSLSLEDLTTFRQYLETIHDSLTRIESDQVVQEEGPQ